MIELKKARKYYYLGKSKNLIFEDVNIALYPNSINVITGPSGSGKSTLLNIFALIDKDFEGDLLFNGERLVDTNLSFKIKSNITYMVQNQSFFNNLTVNQNIKLVSSINDNLLDLVLSKFNLFKVISRVVKKLSGGEKQRLSLIRALASKSAIIILDEPTSNLDALNRKNFLQEVERYKKHRIILIATHDQDLINLADQLFEIKDNKIKLIKSKEKRLIQLKISNLNNRIYPVFLNDLLFNKKNNLIFISTLASSIAGLLLGFVVITGFNRFFISILDNQVNQEIFIIKPRYGSFDVKELSQFENYLICDDGLSIICDRTLGQVYLKVKSGEDMITLKVNHASEIKISSKLHEIISPNLEISFNNQVINLLNAKIISSDEVILEMPFKKINNLALNIKSNVEDIRVIIVNTNKIGDSLMENYIVINPYQEFYKPFDDILDYLKIGLNIYSFIGVTFGMLTIFVLTLLEIDSRKRDIGTLILLGWKEKEIIKWFLSLNFVRVFITFIFQIFMLSFSVFSINLIFEDITGIEKIFNLPNWRFLLGLIIIIEIIVGILTLLVVKRLLKLPPKKLLSNF